MPSRHRIVVPRAKLASDTIRNATIRSRETFAKVAVQVPFTATVLVSALDADATSTIRAAAPDEDAAFLRARGARG
jgi:hypothetical protein